MEAFERQDLSVLARNDFQRPNDAGVVDSLEQRKLPPHAVGFRSGVRLVQLQNDMATVGAADLGENLALPGSVDAALDCVPIDLQHLHAPSSLIGPHSRAMKAPEGNYGAAAVGMSLRSAMGDAMGSS